MDNQTFVNQFRNPKHTGNLILDLNPLSKLNICLAIGLSNFIVKNYYYSFGVVAFLILIAICAGRIKEYLKLYWKVVLLFGVFLFCLKAAFYPGEHVLFRLWGIHVSTEGIQAALLISSEILALSGALIVFAKTTEMSDLTYSLEKMGVSHMASFVMLSSFQTITDLGVNSKVIMDSQKARGIETEGNVWKRMKAYIPVMGPLVINAINGVEEKSIAMDARAFSAPGTHTFLVELPKASVIEKIFVVFVDIAFLLLIVWRIYAWL